MINHLAMHFAPAPSLPPSAPRPHHPRHCSPLADLASLSNCVDGRRRWVLVAHHLFMVHLLWNGWDCCCRINYQLWLDPFSKARSGSLNLWTRTRCRPSSPGRGSARTSCRSGCLGEVVPATDGWTLHCCLWSLLWRSRCQYLPTNYWHVSCDFWTFNCWCRHWHFLCFCQRHSISLKNECSIACPYFYFAFARRPGSYHRNHPRRTLRSISSSSPSSCFPWKSLSGRGHPATWSWAWPLSYRIL